MAPDTSTPGARPIILVLEADYRTDHGIAGLLSGPPANLRVVGCTRLTDLLDTIVRTRPAVVVLVVRGPIEPALEAVKHLRHSIEADAVPVMMVAPATAASRAQALAAGVGDIVALDDNAEEIRARVNTLAEHYRHLMQRNDALHGLALARSEIEHLRTQIAEQPQSKGDTDSLRQRLSGLLHLGHALAQIQDFHTLMERILSEARGMIGADAGTIFIREGESLRFAYCQNETLARRTASGSTPRFASYRVPISDRSIAGWVALSGEPITLDDCHAVDPALPYRFDPSFDQLLGYRTTTMLAVALKLRANRVLGVIELINATDRQGQQGRLFTPQDAALLEHFGSVASVALERTQMTESIILRMIRMAEIRDPSETGAHVERVAGYSAVLFEEWARRRGLLGADFERQRDRLRIAAKLHDVGKIGVPDAILKKPARLDPAEFEQVKRHAEIGGMLFEEQPTDYDEAAREVAMLHHERWDGGGYPGFEVDGQHRGRRGEEIPLFPRIVGIADVFDALSSPRSYKEPWPEERVLEYLQAERGKHFDPELVDIFMARIDEIRAIRDFEPDR